jgi:hypothetical protein
LIPALHHVNCSSSFRKLFIDPKIRGHKKKSGKCKIMHTLHFSYLRLAKFNGLINSIFVKMKGE